MPAVGDIREIVCKHPTLGDFVFYPKAGEDSTYDAGGFRSADDANMVDGGGRNIRQKTQTRWFVESTITWDMDDPDEQQQLSDLAESSEEGTWTFTHSNGVVHKGVGEPVGDIQGNGNAGTISIKISGGGRLEKL